MNKQKIFITGTDTDAGKTLVATTLLYKAQEQGLSCFGLKPVAAGCEWLPTELPSTNNLQTELSDQDTHEEWCNNDALRLQAASQPVQAYRIHNPIALPQAIAPHIAAKLNQQPLSVSHLLDVCRPGLAQDVDVHLVEGAGGWLVPLNEASSCCESETLADFARVLADTQQYDIVLVVGMKLGCINHALLTQQLILSSGLSIKGWVANHIDPHMSEQDSNFAYLKNHLQAPCLGRIPYSPNILAKDLTHFVELPNH